MAMNKPFQSTKVDRTLRELEAAFADWQSLADSGASADSKPDRKSGDEKDANLRKKTQALLEQLRTQLTELGE